MNRTLPFVPPRPRSAPRALALLAALALPAAAHAAPRNVRLSFAGESAASAMSVTWQTDGAEPTFVEFGPTDALGQRVEGASFTGKGNLGQIHEATLTGLQPSTRYSYRVGDGASSWSAIAHFTTAPPDSTECGAFRFVALGDDRADRDGVGPNARWAEIVVEAAGRAPAFVLNSGDLVKNGTDVMEWVNWLASVEPVSASLPIMPALGNHDDDSQEGDAAAYNEIFQLPRNDVTDTEDFYYFTYGNAIFVSLSTVTYKGGATAFADQAAWLDRVLTEHPRRWKVVQFHHPIYTSLDNLPLIGDLIHPPNEMGQNPALVPVFDRHHVDLVIAGHNHYYERYEPLKRGPDWEEGEPAADGTTYVISGGAGAFVYPETAVRLLCGRGDRGSQMCSGLHHFLVFEVAHDRITMEAWATEAQNTGSSPSNRAMIDRVELRKTSGMTAAQCAATGGGSTGGGGRDGGVATDGGARDGGSTGGARDGGKADGGTSTGPTGPTGPTGSSGAGGMDAGATGATGPGGASGATGPAAGGGSGGGDSGGGGCATARHASGVGAAETWGALAGLLAALAVRRRRGARGRARE